MSDISTIWDAAQGRGEWKTASGDLISGSDLETAASISLFSDRRANDDDEIPDGSNDRRGWPGDAGQDYPIGSRIWLLQRAKQTDETLRRAKAYIAEALQWMLDDGVVAKIDIYAEWTRTGMLGAKVTFYQQDGTKLSSNFSWAWGDLS